MKRITCCAAVLTLAASVLAIFHGRAAPPAKERAHGIAARTPWRTSHLSGSPEPPHPYRIVRAFPRLTFRNPLLMTTAPGSDRWFVGEHQGKVYSFPKDPNCARADLFLDPHKELHSWDKNGKVKGVDTVYSLVFHPKFEQNHYCYICYVLLGKNGAEPLPDGSRVSRFTVTNTNPPRIYPKSEKILITWLAGGHNGCDLHFGPDGYLYISTGDAADPNPPDSLDTGQDLSDLLSSILRIDVDHEDKGKTYAVPPDNPFVKTPGARPEIWAYGFRNPWRMSFDRATGDLWVGDVGWELWEMVYRIQRGGNYGWSVMEGPQPVRPESKRGPTPILPPNFAFPHTEGASITGGYVYRGKKYKDLVGAYICGDWVTHKLWATKFEKTGKAPESKDGELTFEPPDKVVWHKELAQGTQRVVSFAQDHDGELYFVNYDEGGTLHQLVPNEAAKDWRDTFPRKLSETGLFTSVRDQQPAPGVLPFSVNAAQWADYATAERFVALPGTSTAKMYDTPIPIPRGFFSGQVFFPKDGVLARTVSLEMERGNPKSRHRLETQVLHYDGEAWHGYTYRWNDEQTDATLVGAAGADQTFTVIDAKAPGGKRKQTWHFPSRAECMTCHNPWAGHTLAFTLLQLNRNHDYNGVLDNQVRAFEHIGLIKLLHKDSDEAPERPLKEVPLAHLTDPHDARADLNERGRSYLHVNCAHCHRFGAGGTADLELRYDTPLEQTKTLEVRPAQGTFEIHGAHILSPGDPYRSVLYYRMAKLGRGRMPHIGSEFVDEQGLRLIHDWIRQLPTLKDGHGLIGKLRALDDSVAKDRSAATVKARAVERADLIRRLLSTTPSALMLAREMGEDRIPASTRTQVLEVATALPDPTVRDLFERFVPDDKRVKRLGSVIKPGQILALKGDAVRGKQLFFKSAGLQCVNCHRIAGTGSTLGPDLSEIGKKYTRAQILESILEPSKSIDPKYVNYLVETTDGRVQNGLLAEKNDREVVLRTTGDKEIRIPAKKVSALVPQKDSLMPELLLRDLTAEQAADLLEFLASLK
jgi:uncharacterized repeat protein (TIGR03806 family)